MKTPKFILSLISLSALIFVVSGCSSIMKPGESGKDLAYTGPTISNARTIPDKVELNKNLQPNQPVQVLADVKDFKSDIKNVRIKFLNIPLEIPMQKMTGTTWSAKVPPERIKTLAVAGKTINYEANVIATNQLGQEALSKDTITVRISAPELIESVG